MKLLAHPDFDSLPDSALIRQSALIPFVIPWSGPTLWRRCKAGDFPKPIKLSAGITAWKVGEVRAWLRSKEAAL
jgi:predicted DNA-binding transcriptional regulator AlpA